MVVLVGDDQFVNRLILSRLRKCIHPDEDDTSLACREFSGDDQPDPRDILDEIATVPMFGDAARIAIVRRADSFVSAHRELLERGCEPRVQTRWIPRSGGSKFFLPTLG